MTSDRHKSAVERFLTDAALTRLEIDRFLDPDAPKWAQFDPELGYLPHDSEVPDGVDGAISTYRYGRWGERRTIQYADHPCRINTYGDSMTQCHQVSDGETWQEYLAAHIGEPIRNFGMGGYGVHQACRRLERMEATDAAAPYIVLNIFLDDHYRSLDAYRTLRLGRWWRDYDMSLSTSMFHANPWTHVRIDAASGDLVEHPNPCPTPESLYQLCDPGFLIERFATDLVVELLVGFKSGDFAFLEEHRELAQTLGVSFPAPPLGPDATTARALYDACALRASMLVVTRTAAALQRAGKQLLVVLSHSVEEVERACATGERDDRPFVEWLAASGLPYVDGLQAHIDDFAAFSIPAEQYVARLFNGHYTPTGNMFYAYAIKDALVGWLSPRPPAYSGVEASFATQAGRLA